MNSITIRQAREADLPVIAKLLQATALVAIDDTAQFGPQYAVAETESGEIVGLAGYERYGSNILLRSVTVAEAARKAGFGARLTVDRLTHARESGCTGAYLLTQTARDYWLRQGFALLDRADAPEGIRRSSEWTTACPASALLMFRSLK